MGGRFCSFIVFGPDSPRVLKFHLSRRAIAVLVMAFLLSFFAVVLMGYTFPEAVNIQSRDQLEAENRALKLESSNAAIGIQKLDAQMSELEELSKRISEELIKKN